MQIKNKSYYFEKLGCKVNSYENDALKGILENEGYVLDDDSPYVVIVNTCSVTSVSDKKSRQVINRLRRQFPASILVAMGCFCQSSSENTLKEIPADIIIGTSNREKIIDLIDVFEKNHTQIIDIDKNFRSFHYESFPLISSCELTRGYVKIQDGCDNFCSYCLIPYIRGASRSRPLEEIIDEINLLIKNGYKEIVLTGVDVASYGKDFKEKNTFSNLLSNIIDSCPDLYRLRISSIEESMIDEAFIKIISNCPNIAHHMHLSLQSGCDSVLKRMNRKYKTEDFYLKMEKIRAVCPDINFTTDVIVGFPGETEQEFQSTMDFVKKCKFSKIHVFPYSRRVGTVADKMPNQISPNVKKERVSRLISVSNDLTKKYNESFNNKEIDFLVESFDKESQKYKAHSSNFLEIEFDGRFEDNLVGKIVKKVVNFDNVK